MANVSAATESPELKEMREQLERIQEQNRMMLDLLQGNPLDRSVNKGLIGQLHQLSTDVAFLIQERKKFKWMVAGAMTTGGVFFTIITFLLKHFFKL